MRRWGAIALAVLSFAMLFRTAQAHHGRDFLLVETPDVPVKGAVFAFATMDRQEFDDGAALEFSPAVLAGLGSRIALELHAHTEKEPGEDWGYEATAGAFRLNLTPESWSRWRVGSSAEYEVADDPDEGRDEVEGRILATRLFGEAATAANLTFNAILEHEQGQGQGGVAWGYAAAFRPRAESRFGWGVEVEGHEGGEESRREILGGLYAQSADRLTLKFGAGAGLGPDAPDYTVRGEVVWRFH